MKFRNTYFPALLAAVGVAMLGAENAAASVFDVSTDNTTDNWNASTRWTLSSGTGTTPALTGVDSLSFVNTTTTNSIVALNLGSATLSSVTFGTADAGTDVSRQISFRGSGTVARSFATTGDLIKYDSGTLAFYSVSASGTLAVSVGGNLQVNAGTVNFGRDTSNNLVGLSVAGTTTISGGTVNIRSSTDSTFGAVSMSGGAFNIAYLSGISARTISVASLEGNGGTIGQTTTGTGYVTTLAITGSATKEYSGTISNGTGTGSIAVTKSGAGVQTLSGSNTYASGTTVSAGTLLVNNTTGSGLGTGDVAVNGGTLGGTGSFTGKVTVNAGGTMAPGAGIESLGAGGVTFTGGTFAFELNTSGSPTADLLYAANSSTALSIANGATTLSLTDLGSNVALAAGTKFTLISYTAAGGWNGGVFTGYADGSTFTLGSNTWTIDYDDTSAGINYSANATNFGDRFVTITTVPEPSTWALLLGGAAGMIWIRARRRAAAQVLA